MGEIENKKDGNLTSKGGVWWKPAFEIFSEVSTWIAVPIILALITGKALDKKYGTGPYILLGFTVLSFIVSSFGIIKTVKKYMKKITEESNKKNSK